MIPPFTCVANLYHYLLLIFFSGNLASDIALKAVKTVLREENDKKEIDIKNYAKVEKVSSTIYRGFQTGFQF